MQTQAGTTAHAKSMWVRLSAELQASFALLFEAVYPKLVAL